MWVRIPYPRRDEEIGRACHSPRSLTLLPSRNRKESGSSSSSGSCSAGIIQQNPLFDSALSTSALNVGGKLRQDAIASNSLVPPESPSTGCNIFDRSGCRNGGRSCFGWGVVATRQRPNHRPSTAISSNRDGSLGCTLWWEKYTPLHLNRPNTFAMRMRRTALPAESSRTPHRHRSPAYTLCCGTRSPYRLASSVSRVGHLVNLPFPHARLPGRFHRFASYTLNPIVSFAPRYTHPRSNLGYIIDCCRIHSTARCSVCSGVNSGW